MGEGALHVHRVGAAALHVHRVGAAALQAAASAILAPLTVTASPPGGAPFHADVDAAPMGRLAVARIRGSGHLVARTSRTITSFDPELLKLTLHRSRPALADQGGQQSQARAGDFVAFDMTRPYRLEVMDGCDVLAVGVPRAELGRHADAIGRQTARRLPAGTGAQAVLAAFLDGLGRHLDELAGPANAYVGDALVSLLVAAFTERAPGRMDTATELVDRIRVHALANISDPSLCVASVAAAHGISDGRLHRLFQRAGTPFWAWLRQERFARIHRDLRDPAHDGRTIASVAARWGIHDPRHVGRGLKEQYGLTARDLRRRLRSSD
ncbi:MAG: helix-turn-helix domain-containing protein [Streptomyces sp.]|nr:helix-turn-helix domain-containing protein [Streptomyces sp.]